MKYLLIFLICFSAYGMHETHDEVNALTINDVLPRLLTGAYPDCTYSVTENSPWEFEFLINDLGTPECAATIPTLEAKLVEYKAYWNDIITQRELFQAKVVEVKAAYLPLRKCFHRLQQLAGKPHISNPDAYIRDYVVNINKANQALAYLQDLQPHLATCEAERQAVIDKQILKKQAQDFLNSYDCETITNNLNKAICLVNQR